MLAGERESRELVGAAGLGREAGPRMVLCPAAIASAAWSIVMCEATK